MSTTNHKTSLLFSQLLNMNLHSFSSTALLAVHLLSDPSLAFSPTTPSSSQRMLTHTTRQPSTQLHSAQDRIKKAGAGITTQPAGGLSCFDPNENGKLQGSYTLDDRVSKGAAFPSVGGQSPPPPSAVAKPSVSSPVVTEPIRKGKFSNLTDLVNGNMDQRFKDRPTRSGY